MSKYVIDCKKGSIEKIENVDISVTELKILSLLSNNEFVDTKDIAKFLNSNIEDTANIRMHIHRLRQKGFHIENMQGAHCKYKLFEEVYFK